MTQATPKTRRKVDARHVQRPRTGRGPFVNLTKIDRGEQIASG